MRASVRVATTTRAELRAKHCLLTRGAVPSRRRSRYSCWNRRCSNLPSSVRRHARCQSRRCSRRAAAAQLLEQYRYRRSQARQSGNSSPQRGHRRRTSSSTRQQAPALWTPRSGRENQDRNGGLDARRRSPRAARSSNSGPSFCPGLPTAPLRHERTRQQVRPIAADAITRARHDRWPALFDARFHVTGRDRPSSTKWLVPAGSGAPDSSR